MLCVLVVLGMFMFVNGMSFLMNVMCPSTFMFPVYVYGGVVRYLWCFKFLCEFKKSYCDDVWLHFLCEFF